MSSREEAERRIQEKLAAARALLIEAGSIADEEGIEFIDFMGLNHERSFGWFHGEDLREPSGWNSSACVIGSVLAAGGSPNDPHWQSSSSCYSY